MNDERLKYGDRIIYMEGICVDVDDCSISVDLKGRLGFFKAPKRMFICDTEPKIGQEFGWHMSFPEQLGPEIHEKYVSNLEKERRKQVFHICRINLFRLTASWISGKKCERISSVFYHLTSHGCIAFG